MGEFPKILRDAHAGDLYSQIKLVQIYRSDGVVPKNFPEAQKWAHIAVGRGSPEAAMLLSEMYMKGEGVSIDHLESERLCRLAAEAGFDRAQWSLAKMYLEGVVLKQDVNAALKWLNSSAAQGYESAIMDLAEIYETGNVVPQDYVLAYLYCSLALKADYLGRGKTHPAWAAAVRIKSDLSPDQIQKAEAMEAKVLELRAMKAITTALNT